MCEVMIQSRDMLEKCVDFTQFCAFYQGFGSTWKQRYKVCVAWLDNRGSTLLWGIRQCGTVRTCDSSKYRCEHTQSILVPSDPDVVTFFCNVNANVTWATLKGCQLNSHPQRARYVFILWADSVRYYYQCTTSERSQRFGASWVGSAENKRAMFK